MTQHAPHEAAPATRYPPVVLLTGWGSTVRVFDGLIELLKIGAGSRAWPAPTESAVRAWTARDLAVRAASLDMADTPTDASPDQVLDWALAALTLEVPPGAVLVGWSLGGALALRFAARYPGRLAAVVTVATNPCFCARPGWEEGMPEAEFAAFRAAYRADAAAHLARFAALQAVGDAQAAVVRRALRDARPDDARCSRFGPALDVLAALDVREDLRALAIPVLHVLGENDPVVPVSLADRLPELSPAASVWIASGTAHAPFLSRPAAFAARLCDFIASLDPPVRRAAPGVARSFGRAAESYDAGAALQRHCASRLLSRAPHCAPARVLDLGCGTGAMLPALQARFPGADVLAADIAPAMLGVARRRAPQIACIAADAERLPLAQASVGLVFSSLALQWCGSIDRAFGEIARVLGPGGVALLALPGPSTLWELRAAWRAVDGRDHVNRFLPLPALLASARAAGLHPQRVECEAHTERHAHARAVARSLRAIGANTLDADRRTGLVGKQAWTRLDAHYAALADAGAGLPATWEFLYLLLEKPHGT